MPTQHLFNQLDDLFPSKLDFDTSLDSFLDDEYETSSLTSVEEDLHFARNNSTKSNITFKSSNTFYTIGTNGTTLTSPSTYRESDKWSHRSDRTIINEPVKNHKQVTGVKSASQSIDRSTPMQRAKAEELAFVFERNKEGMSNKGKLANIPMASEDIIRKNATRTKRLHNHLHQQDTNLNNILDCLNDMIIQQDALLQEELKQVISDIELSVPHNTFTIRKFKLAFNKDKRRE